MSAFASAFREIVIPDLARMCQSRGLFVALDLDGYSEAFDEIVATAARRGALHLAGDMFRQLEDWIATELLKAVDTHAAACRHFEVMADKDVWSIILERPWPTT